jgi:hypothetical protein
MKIVEKELDKIIKETEEKYRKKVKKFSEEDIFRSNVKFLNEIQPIIIDFYGGYHPKGKYANLKEQAYIDFLYKYYVTHPDHVWDERYDQLIFASAERYAEKEVAKEKKEVKV